MTTIDQIIEEAMRRGEFQGLEGEGERLDLTQDPNADPTWRMAHRMLKERGYSLPWIELRKEIENDLQAARSTLQSAWEWRPRQSNPERKSPAWHSKLQAFGEKMLAINRKIDHYNLIVPLDRFQLQPLDPEHEVGRIVPSHSDENRS